MYDQTSGSNAKTSCVPALLALLCSCLLRSRCLPHLKANNCTQGGSTQSPFHLLTSILPSIVPNNNLTSCSLTPPCLTSKHFIITQRHKASLTTLYCLIYKDASDQSLLGATPYRPRAFCSLSSLLYNSLSTSPTSASDFHPFQQQLLIVVKILTPSWLPCSPSHHSACNQRPTTTPWKFPLTKATPTVT